MFVPLRLAGICFAIALSFSASAGVQVVVGERPDVGRMIGIYIEGPISSGDYKTLLEGINEHRGSFTLKFAVLNSTGGSVYEAMKMGRLLRQAKFDVLIESDGTCQSACVYLLAAGIDKKVRGTVGIHRPYFGVAPNIDAGVSIKKIKAISAEYFEDMNISPRLAEDMYSIEPKDMKILSHSELESYRLNKNDFVAEEQSAAQNMRSMGWSREQYESFMADLTYRCTIYTGNPQKMQPCIRDVAINHNASPEIIESLSK